MDEHSRLKALMAIVDVHKVFSGMDYSILYALQPYALIEASGFVREFAKSQGFRRWLYRIL
jgi:hypothetical protein